MGTRVFHSPEVFRVRGRWPPPDSVAVVGTRTPSPWGWRLAREVAAAAGRDGWCVVSGLSPGIDTAAHRGALGVGARTVAFVGTGLDALTDADLGAAIVSGGGGLVSVLADDDPGDAHTRARRNRFQVAAARVVVVVEASSPCGTMVTAAFAGSFGRPLVVATPPDLAATATSAAGSRMLISGGGPAIPTVVVPAGADGTTLWRQASEASRP